MLVDEPIRLPARALDSHKGDYGRVLVIAGSRGMSGAAILAGIAALRGGAGLVRVAVPRGIASIVAGAHPCFMTVPLDEDAEGRFAATASDELTRQIEWSTVVVAGPGLGRSEDLDSIVGSLVRSDRPMVLDADGLNALALDQLKDRTAPIVLTPHPGEFSRLTGEPAPRGELRRMEAAQAFIQTLPGVLVLKGAGTIVADVHRLYINRTGNPGMATGGTGDVLSGLIGALLGQGLEAFEAAALGVHVHGLAGDLAAQRLGEPSLLATDILDELPAALRSRTESRTQGS